MKLYKKVHFLYSENLLFQDSLPLKNSAKIDTTDKTENWKKRFIYPLFSLSPSLLKIEIVWNFIFFISEKRKKKKSRREIKAAITNTSLECEGF